MNRIIGWSLALVALSLASCAWAQVAPAGTSLPAGGYASIALDPSAAGVSAVNNAAELLKSDPESAINFFTGLLSDTRNASVQRMIRFQLVDLYKQTGRNDQALEQLKALIEQAPPVASSTPQVIQIVPADNSTTPTTPAQPQQ